MQKAHFISGALENLYNILTKIAVQANLAVGCFEVFSSKSIHICCSWKEGPHQDKIGHKIKVFKKTLQFDGNNDRRSECNIRTNARIYFHSVILKDVEIVEPKSNAWHLPLLDNVPSAKEQFYDALKNLPTEHLLKITQHQRYLPVVKRYQILARRITSRLIHRSPLQTATKGAG